MKSDEPQAGTIRYEIPRWLANEFRETEQLLWVGRPSPKLHFRHADAFALYSIVVGFIAGYMAFFLMKAAFMGVLMWSYAVFLLLGRHRYDAKKRATTWYALTDQRALIGTNFFIPEKIFSYPKDKWRPLELVKESEGHTIWFTQKSGFGHGLNGSIRHGFMMINDGPHIFELMKSVRGIR